MNNWALCGLTDEYHVNLFYWVVWDLWGGGWCGICGSGKKVKGR